jgi:transposase
VVGDGHAMGVAAQIVHYVSGATKGTFQIDHPILSMERPQPSGEDLGLRQKLQVSVEVQLAILKSLFESVDEFAAKEFRQRIHPDWRRRYMHLAMRRHKSIAKVATPRVLRQEVRRDLLAESRKHKAWKRLCQIPSIGPIRAAVLLGILQTPHRFRSKRPLWNYGGLAIEMHSSADHRSVD